MTTVRLIAVWLTLTSALISWQSAQPACLSVTHATGQQVFIGRYEAGARVTLAGGDAAYHPQIHDLYFLTDCKGAILARAPLRSVVYLPRV